MLFKKKRLIKPFGTYSFPKDVASQQKRFFSCLKKKLEEGGSSFEGFAQRSFYFQPFYSKFSEYYPDKEIPKQEFLEWFIGFVEGEGCFSVSKRGKFLFTIVQSSKDVQVLNYIQENLGFGSIGLMSNKRTHRFWVGDTKNIYILCLLFNGNMVFPTRNAKFLTFLSFFNERLLKKNIFVPIIPSTERAIPSLDDYWLSGLVDGEGCFSLSFLSNSNKFRLIFLITQKWKVNKPVLDHILSLFDCHGLVYCRSRKNLDYWDLKINGLKNCSALFLYFDKYTLKTKKKDSYLRWKLIYYRLIQGDHLKANTKQELIDLAKKINKFD